MKTRFKMVTSILLFSLLAFLALGLAGCDRSGRGGCGSTDTDTKTDTGTSTDANTATDTSSTTGTATESDTATNTATTTATDSNTATDTDTASDTATVTETDTATDTNTNSSTDTGTDSSDDQDQSYSPVENGTSGYATRYWDCCKPHCGWTDNVGSDVNPVGTCNVDNQSNGTDYLVTSSCDGGDGYTCYNMAPYAVSDTLAYGYAAVSASGDICGKCYQLDFTGTSYNGGDDPGSQALAGKTMIVQATNIGYDVSNGQIDLMVPGGGVGAFDACTEQWGATSDQMGERYGGFLTSCKYELGWNAGLDEYKSCVMERCEDLFSQDGMEDLLAGCQWFVDWFQVADNPALEFQEVECPDALNNVSGMLP